MALTMKNEYNRNILPGYSIGIQINCIFVLFTTTFVQTMSYGLTKIVIITYEENISQFHML